MHIPDGILSIPFIIIGWFSSIIILYILLNRYTSQELTELIPKISVLTASFFVVSFIYIPLGVTSIHLMFIGPISIMLGSMSYICIFVSLILQSIFLHCGGLLSLGINSIIIGGCSILNNFFYNILKKIMNVLYAGFISTFISLLISYIILYLILYINGTFINLNFKYFIQFHMIPSVVTVIIESIITIFVLHFLNIIKPEFIYKEKNLK